jgi:hypothetical protein
MHRYMERGIGWFLRATGRFLWFATPVIIWSMGVALASFYHGVPNTTQMMADQWTSALKSAYGLPGNRRDFYNRGTQLVAIFFVVFGWVCASFTTVFLVMWLFR